MTTHEALIVAVGQDGYSILDYTTVECNDLSDACSILENKIQEYDGVSISTVHYLSDTQRSFSLKRAGKNKISIIVKIKKNDVQPDSSSDVGYYSIRYSEYVNDERKDTRLYLSFNTISDARNSLNSSLEVDAKTMEMNPYISNKAINKTSNGYTAEFNTRFGDKIAHEYLIVKIVDGTEFLV